MKYDTPQYTHVYKKLDIQKPKLFQQRAVQNSYVI